MRPGSWKRLRRDNCTHCRTPLEVWRVQLPRSRKVVLSICPTCDHLEPVGREPSA